MALICVVRDKPEYAGGALSMTIPEEDFPKVNVRGWRKADSKADKVEDKKAEEPKKVDEAKSEDKKVEEPVKHFGKAGK